MWRYRLALEVARVAVVAGLVEIGLRVSRLPQVARWCGVRLDLTSPTSAGSGFRRPPLTWRQLRAVDLVMNRWPFGDTCLRRCLVLGHRIRRTEPVLRIGIPQDPGQPFIAHSWLEVDGCPLDDDSRQFAAFGSPAA